MSGWPVQYWWVKSEQYWNLPKHKVTRWIYHCNRVILNILNKRNNSLCFLLGSKDWTQNMRLGWRFRSFWKTVSRTHSSMIATVNDIWMYFHNFNGGCHSYVHVVTLLRDVFTLNLSKIGFSYLYHMNIVFADSEDLCHTFRDCKYCTKMYVHCKCIKVNSWQISTEWTPPTPSPLSNF